MSRPRDAFKWKRRSVIDSRFDYDEGCAPDKSDQDQEQFRSRALGQEIHPWVWNASVRQELDPIAADSRLYLRAIRAGVGHESSTPAAA